MSAEHFYICLVKEEEVLLHRGSAPSWFNVWGAWAEETKAGGSARATDDIGLGNGAEMELIHGWLTKKGR